MIMNKTKNPLNSGYQPKTMNNSKQHFVGNGWFSDTRSHIIHCNYSQPAAVMEVATPEEVLQ